MKYHGQQERAQVPQAQPQMDRRTGLLMDSWRYGQRNAMRDSLHAAHVASPSGRFTQQEQ